MIKSFKQAFQSTGPDIPKFTTPESEPAKDYEERRYEAAKWASAVIEGEVEKEAVKKGFKKLYSYIQGKNDKGVKIEMISPVINLVTHGSSNYTVSFFLPSSYQSNPPAPTQSGIFIEEKRAMTIFVRSFGGFTSTQRNAESARLLAESLKRDGRPFHEEFYYTAGYDSPFKLINRRNEVWLLKRD
ncbi:heme-binding protein 2-like [Erpetoichthys calabaricus]|uniref:Heme-binding protein 2 n=1 Tax=Erpetoichthys calabaricus TaxID=27687 RepID=A0A8C4XAQ5_ERPCA|nr:heme-binding protein 2-like [Erpetoichthys calabaricus]